MSLAKDAIAAHPELANPKNWPAIDFDALPPKKRPKTERNWNIVLALSKGMSGKDVAERYNVSESFVSRLWKRCFKKDRNGVYYLTRAIVTRNVLVEPSRRSKAPTKLNDKGNRCAFTNLFVLYPALLLKLQQMIEAYLKKEPWAQNLKPKHLHNALMLFLQQENHSADEYPNNTVSKGSESIRLFYHAEINRQIERNKKARYITKKPNIYRRPFREIQVDAQTTDINTKISLQYEDEVFDLRLSRVTLLLAVCVDTSAILAWHLALTRAPTTADLLQLFNNIFARWEPWDLRTPGLQYLPGSGFPSGLVSEVKHVGLNKVSMDNAYAHQSRALIRLVCDDYGGWMNFGPPATPIIRNYVEHAFHIVNQTTHRFASTTGSHPKDPKKETLKNSKKPPLLTLNSFEEVLEVSLAEYNGTPKRRLDGQTPLDAMRRAFKTQPIRMNFGSKHETVEPFIRKKERTIYCSKRELRRPHVFFLGLKYSSPQFTDRNLGGTKVVVKYDLRDLRKINISKPDGTHLGTLDVQTTHRHRPLSYKTWQEIKKFERDHYSLGRDPIAGLMNYFLENKKTPNIATHLLRVYREIEQDGQVVLPKKRSASIFNISRWFTKEKATTLRDASWSDNLRNLDD